MYAYNFGSVSAARFGILIALGFVAFAYIGGITMVSGAVVGGLVATEGLIPYTIEEAFNISGNWTLLVGGLILIVTLIQNPDGIAGTTHRKRMAAKRAKAAAAARSDAGSGELDGGGGVTAEPQLVGES
jgi:branched-chain amino acid transport system permease protein